MGHVNEFIQTLYYVFFLNCEDINLFHVFIYIPNAQKHE